MRESSYWFIEYPVAVERQRPDDPGHQPNDNTGNRRNSLRPVHSPQFLFWIGMLHLIQVVDLDDSGCRCAILDLGQEEEDAPIEVLGLWRQGQ